MSDAHPQPEPRRDDVLAELEAEVAHELEEHRPPPGGPAYQTVAALVTLAVGVLGAVLAHGYGLGSLRRHGPGLWPMACATLVIALSLVLPTFVGLGLLIPAIGFEIPALGLCIVWLRFLGGESWRSTLVVSVGTVAAFYALFLHALRIPLPHLF